MNRNSVLDLLGVARSVAVAAACIGLLMLVTVFLLALAGVGIWSTAAFGTGALGLFVLGVIVVLVTSLSRVLVARMKFYSPEA